MITSARNTIRALIAPQHKLAFTARLWEDLRCTLVERGDGVRESGAFLLGRSDRSGRGVIEHYVPYDDLDPHCLDSGIVRFNGSGYGPLFSICREKNLAVLADIHTHEGEAFLSGADRDHPMMSQAGHVAIIMPGYALRRVPLRQLGLYSYQGRKTWQDWSGAVARKKLWIGW